MPADLILANDGIKYAGGNIIDLKAAMPTTGSYVAGDIVLESTTGQRISGWKRLTTGSNHVLGTDWAYVSASPQLGTAVATTSGTSIDFTGIPSWVKRVTVMLAGVSTSGTSPVRLQIGGGSVETTGYESTSTVMGVANGTSTGGFDRYQTAAADITNGVYVLTHIGSNQWVCAAQYALNTASNPGWINGRKTTAAALDRVRLTTVGGTDTFDAGSVNILWE